MDLSFLFELPERWERRADEFHAHGAEGVAKTLEKIAEELRQKLEAGLDEPLAPEEAADETGYTADHIRRLIRRDKLPNAGDDTSLKIRRKHLPRKPGHTLGRARSKQVGSRSRVARTVLDSDQEAEDG